MIYYKGCNRVFSKYYGKENFIYLAKKNILESIQEISNRTIRNQVEKEGLDKLHYFFSPDYLPFLVELLKEKFNKSMYKQIYHAASKDMKLKNKTFYQSKFILYSKHLINVSFISFKISNNQ